GGVAGLLFFFSSRRRHTRLVSDWSSDVCSSDLLRHAGASARTAAYDAVASRSGKLRRRNAARCKVSDLLSGETRLDLNHLTGDRSEERRVGKECRYRRATEQ